jgi:hypothetical protein
VVPASSSFAPVRRALAAIDSVHGDGDLPQLPVVRTRAATEAGAYQWNDRTGEALRLRFSGLGGHPELTIVHEVGHFLDHQTFGRPGAYASETGALARLMRVIDRTETLHRLRSLRTRRQAIVDERGRREIEPIRQQRVAYLLEPREIFARAYSQFIAWESGDAVLAAQLEFLRSTRRVRVYHDFWTDADFAAVVHELRQLLGRRRW